MHLKSNYVLYNKYMKKLLTILILLISICSCTTKQVQTLTLDVLEDSKFDGIYAKISLEDFKNKGFEYGDSLDISFSNGLEFNDLPYYSGFYVKAGQPLVVGYQGYQYIEITRASFGLWKESGLKEGDTVNITLNTKHKYLSKEETFSLVYSNDINDYNSEIEFSNFRSLKAGNLKENYLYRGASPIDDSNSRVIPVNGLLETNSIKYVIDLADSEEEYIEFNKEYGLEDAYINTLYKNNSIVFLDMSASYSGQEYKESLSKGLKAIIENDGPFYIHCLEGKDRTGFVCLILELIADATYDEALNDYMHTYYNYYSITKQEQERYNSIKEVYFDSFIEYLEQEYNKETLKEDAIEYLLSTGLTNKQIDDLIGKITK